MIYTYISSRTFYCGRGCDACNNTGYKGRIALLEILKSSDRIHNLVIQSSSAAEIRRVAREEGMKTLRESGLQYIYDGTTTVEEVVRETISML